MRSLSFIISLILFLLGNFLFAQSPHGDDLNFDCSACHNSDTWKVDFSKNKFDHDETGFSLSGQHKLVDCKSCHEDLVFSKAAPECNSCHTDIHQESVGLDCARCHTSNSWIVEDINRIHQERRFPLLGNHLFADCAQCHSRYADLYFEPLDVDCFSCHQKDYNSTSFPNHTAAGFSTDCEMCHSINSDGWAATSIIHDFFPLVGGHAIQDCFACHQQGGDFTGLTQDCYSCHRQDYESTSDPNHVANSFPTDCKQCHTIMGWSPATFDHNQTAFPLTGKHITVNCADCHASGYSGTPTDCYSCHQQDFQSTTDPNHVANGFPTDCSQCHNTSSWDDTDFDHNQTAFPLTGKHATTSCIDCHSTGYTNTPTDCYSCHQQDYETTNDPNHVANSFPTDCSQCHNTNNWDDANFDHNQTGFSLTGKHTSTSCIDCHSAGYTNTSTDCYSCHQQDYESTNDPNHVANSFPTDCSQCHNTNNWDDADFDHNQTGFPLTGKHTTTSCIDCHSAGYTNTPTDCYSCHQQDYESTNDPNHVTNSFPTDCSQCHSTNNWDDANFDHNQTAFPLTGKHTTTSCIDCHSAGYINTPTDCYSCHQQNYESANDPNHVTNSFPTDCSQCHNTNNWDDANFDHNQTAFPLTGKHTSTSCIDCHSTGYTDTPMDCYSCHQQNYESANDPNHVTNSFPTDCSQCHNTNGWGDAAFDHAQTNFPLTGRHTTVNCIDCHSSGYTNTPTDCYSCHSSNYNSTTDPPHQSLGLPTTCEDCHSTFDWSGASFDHSFYNLSGNHRTMACNECHSEPNYQPQCLSCHQNDFLDEHHQGDPTDCWNCHSTSRWEDGNRLKIKNIQPR